MKRIREKTRHRVGLVVVVLALGLGGCATSPQQQAFAYNDKGELVEVEPEKKDSSGAWAVVAGLAVGALIVSLSDDSDGGNKGSDCYWVVGPNGSTKVCR